MEFEGPEKKLEIVLKQPRVDLRGNVDGRWDRVVESAYTRILSSVSNKYFDAYLLSESSLFVYPDRIILITCGGSRPFQAVPTILQFIDPSEIRYIFYERKNLLYPEAQLCDFQVETREMHRLFPGQKWLIGEENKDHIYFFFATGQDGIVYDTPKVPDTTLEILMHGISEDVAQLFYHDPEVSTSALRYRSGIEFLFQSPDVIYDDYLFHPCGYSVNALLNEGYFTIHITPQSICSYVSFETNIDIDNPSELVQKVLDCFNPKRFTYVVTSNAYPKLESIHNECYDETFRKTVSIGHGYKVHFRNYNYQDCLATVLV